MNIRELIRRDYEAIVKTAERMAPTCTGTEREVWVRIAEGYRPLANDLGPDAAVRDLSRPVRQGFL